MVTALPCLCHLHAWCRLVPPPSAQTWPGPCPSFPWGGYGPLPSTPCAEGAGDGPPFVWGFPVYLAGCWAVSTPHLLRTNSIHTSTDICEVPTTRQLWLWPKMGRGRACAWRLPPRRGPWIISTLSNLSSSHHPSKLHISVSSLESSPLPASSFLLIQPPSPGLWVQPMCGHCPRHRGLTRQFWCHV